MEATDQTSHYRPVSRLAVVAAAAGVVASLALVTPLFWILPLVGVALAVAGLADVTRSGAEKAGRSAALVGLALSVGFGAQAVTASLVSRLISESRVKAVTHAWLDALQENRLSDAQSMLAPHLLPQTESDEHQHGAEGHPGHQGDEKHPSIDSLPAVMAIIGCGKAAVRDVRCTGRDEETGERWCATIRLAPCTTGGAIEARLHLVPAVVNDPRQRVERWTIVEIDLIP
jgi:hypothetical protein